MDEKPKLIMAWNGRVTEVVTDDHNLFMSAVDSPLDYSYTPAAADDIQPDHVVGE